MSSRTMRPERCPARSEALKATARLGLGASYTFDELLQAVERFRGRRVDIRPVRGLGADQISGLWVSSSAVELILHAETDSRFYRDQIVLHEIAHMILGHDLLTPGMSVSHTLFPDLPPEMVNRVLARCGQQNPLEIEAETVADMLAAGISWSRRSRPNQPLNFERVFG